MASSHTSTTTMEDLCKVNQSLGGNGDNEYFEKLVAAINKHYPRDWKSWLVEDLSYKDVFGDNMCPKIEAKLRFALPTEEIQNIFCPSGTRITEKTYKAARRVLADWALGRAIIYQPHSIVAKIHTDPYDYEKFMDTVKTIKTKVYSIRGGSSERQVTPDRHTKKRSATQEPTCTSAPKSRKEDDEHLAVLQNIMALISSQSAAIESLSKRVENVEKKDELESAHNTSFESVDSTTGEEESWQPPEMLIPDTRLESNTTQINSLTKQIAAAQRELAQLTGSTEFANVDQEENLNNSNTWNFAPSTSEAEAKITKASPHLVEQVINCQRFNEDGWKNIRFSDVQKTFQATPAFCALKVNSHLASNTPNWQSLAQLEKTDLILGAITHGLLQQREALKESYKDLSPATQKELGEKLLGGDSKFKKITDQLLQYTCGRRAEIIQTRRETYKSTNKVLNDILHEIPPSQSHLFAEDKLAEAMKEQGGAHKFFPRKTLTTTRKTSKPTPATSSAPFPKNYKTSQSNWKTTRKPQYYNRRQNIKPDHSNKNKAPTTKKP